jgi:hypothetical protein
MVKAQSLFKMALTVTVSVWTFLANLVPLAADSPTPTPSLAATGNPDSSWRLIFILVGSLVFATAILAGVIIYVLKMFRQKY